MNPWNRDDTKEWINQLESRIKDIHYYLVETVQWCEKHSVYEDEVVLACSIMTLVWVCHMRGESLSKIEALEILGIPDADILEDQEYHLNESFFGCDHEKLLETVVRSFS